MANRSRTYLKEKFEDGDRPTGEHFADMIDSVINKVDDNVQLDPNGNLTIPGGLNLSNTINGQEGTLRFNANQLEVFSGGIWNPVAGGGGGAFIPVGGGPDVAFGGGNVGIGSFLSQPTNKLEVPLAANSGASERVRLGNLIVHNGQANDAAYISHQNATLDNNFAVRQDSQANTTVNAGSNAVLSLNQAGVPRMRLTNTGNITLTPQTSVTIEANTAIGSPVQPRDLFVFGQAFKTVAGPFVGISDSRVKKDVKTLDMGLTEIKKLKPVSYKYNGEGGTPNDGKEYVGLIAQEVQKVVPSMVDQSKFAEQQGMPNMLTLDPNPLMYIMINAIQELAGRVEQLESQLAGKSKQKK